MTAPFPNVFRSRLTQVCAAAWLAVAAPQAALAANVSLSGNLFQDNSVQFLTLTLSGAGAITVTGIGYAGGTDHYGNTVSAGGFDTWMGLYNSAGALVQGSDDGSSVPDPITGETFDTSFTTASLAAGVYLLAVTQADNTPLGFNLADGFSHAGNANFTAAYGCTNGQFCDITGANRTSSWAINFSGQTLASVVPEPGSLALVLAAGGVLVALRRQRPALKGGARQPAFAAA